MTRTEYKLIMKEAKKEFNDWLKDNKKARALVKKAATKIRMATLASRSTKKKAVKKKAVKKVVKKKVVKKKVTKKPTKKVARKKK